MAFDVRGALRSTTTYALIVAAGFVSALCAGAGGAWAVVSGGALQWSAAALGVALVVAALVWRELVRGHRAAARAWASVRENEERLRRALEVRDEVLAVVSHDLKNPLAAIVMTASRMEDVARRRGDLAGVKSMQRIRRSADRMTRLIFDLLDVASIDAGRLSVEPAPCDAAGLLVDAVEAIRPLAAEKDLALTCVVDDAVADVRADRERVAQVLSNLLGNAVKFTEAGGAVRLFADVDGEHVRFSVVDDGPGMPAEHVARAFDRFWRARPEGRVGTGLGLSIVKGIVDAHGGRVWVESEVGRGTAVRFTLPAAPASGRRSVFTLPGRSCRASSTARAAAPAPTSSTSP